MPQTYVSGKRGALQLGRGATGTGMVGKSCEKKHLKHSSVCNFILCCHHQHAPRQRMGDARSLIHFLLSQ